MARITHIFLLIWTTLIESILSAEYCYNWSYSTTYYCEWGCCGDSWDRYCCAFNLVGLIVGACIGGIALIVFGVVAIVYYMKKKGQPGRVVQPAQTTTVAVVNTSGQQNYPTNYTQSGGTGYPTTQRQAVVSTTKTQNYPTGSYGQAYPPPYGQAYPQGSYGQAYPPTGAVPQSTAGQPVYPPSSQTANQAQYPPGPPPEASIYNDPNEQRK